MMNKSIMICMLLYSVTLIGAERIKRQWFFTWSPNRLAVNSYPAPYPSPQTMLRQAQEPASVTNPEQLEETPKPQISNSNLACCVIGAIVTCVSCCLQYGPARQQ